MDQFIKRIQLAALKRDYHITNDKVIYYDDTEEVPIEVMQSVSDKGTYFASSGEFVSKDGSEVDSEYVKYMNNVVSNKITMSRYIMKYDYYRKVLGG